MTYQDDQDERGEYEREKAEALHDRTWWIDNITDMCADDGPESILPAIHAIDDHRTLCELVYLLIGLRADLRKRDAELIGDD